MPPSRRPGSRAARAASAVLLLGLLVAAGLPGGSIPRATAGTFVYPLLDTRVSSSFGMRRHPIQRIVRHHHGIDLAAPQGASIRAIAGGMVVFADPYAGYGNLIVVQHGRGMTSHYGHCASFRVKPGQRIRAGEIIGTVGTTGITTGPHLHFEIRRDGEPLDPESLMPGLAEVAAG